jgi:hypothetical protein
MNRQCVTEKAKRGELLAAFLFFKLILFAASLGDFKSRFLFFYCECSHPLWFWGRDILAFGREDRGIPIPTRGQTLFNIILY